MSPDDPEFLQCTCVHRSLKDPEKVQYIMPSGLVLTVAKDCPEHGIVVHDTADEGSKNPA